MVPQICFLDLFLIIAFALRLCDHECSILSHFSHILKMDYDLRFSILFLIKGKVQSMEHNLVGEKTWTQYRDW